MNVSPARKKKRCVISTAAATFRTRPVIEIAFGVSRDSISRLRISVRNSAVVGAAPLAVGDDRRSLARRSARRRVIAGTTRRLLRAQRERHAQAAGRRRENTAAETSAAANATRAPAAASSHQWLPVTITTSVTTAG